MYFHLRNSMVYIFYNVITLQWNELKKKKTNATEKKEKQYFEISLSE